MHPYASLPYAEALSHVGCPVAVPEWGTPVLVRSIPGLSTGEDDAMGVYPMTSLANAGDIAGGLERLRALGLVSVVIVPDPLTGPSSETLRRAFTHVRPFKTHLTVDPAAGPYSPTSYHAYRIRRGHRRCEIGHGPLGPLLGDWQRLYHGLVAHRGVTGAADFPDGSLEVMAEMAGLTAFSATVAGRIVGMTLWFAHGGVVYHHLTAVDSEGYANGASFALCDSAIRHFEGQGVVNLGGGAGTGSGEGGLFDFKRGFANSEATAMICGAVLDAPRYADLSAGVETDFFPAYRAARDPSS